MFEMRTNGTLLCKLWLEFRTRYFYIKITEHQLGLILPKLWLCLNKRIVEGVTSHHAQVVDIFPEQQDLVECAYLKY